MGMNLMVIWFVCETIENWIWKHIVTLSLESLVESLTFFWKDIKSYGNVYLFWLKTPYFYIQRTFFPVENIWFLFWTSKRTHKQFDLFSEQFNLAAFKDKEEEHADLLSSANEMKVRATIWFVKIPPLVPWFFFSFLLFCNTIIKMKPNLKKENCSEAQTKYNII